MRSMAAKMIKYGGGGKNEKYADKIIEKYGGKLLYINWRQKFHESGPREQQGVVSDLLSLGMAGCLQTPRF